MKEYEATNLDKTMFWKLPYLFEYTDRVAMIGYAHAVYPAFTMEEVLLTRAEAYTMLSEYDLAAADLTTYVHSIIRPTNFSGTLLRSRSSRFTPRSIMRLGTNPPSRSTSTPLSTSGPRVDFASA